MKDGCLEEYLDDNFFVISSDNAFSIVPRLYGYAFLDDRVYINGDGFDIPADAPGCFVNIMRASSTVLEVWQDYFSCYGLYLYQTDDYFALSNSYLYLVNYLKTRKRLTFNLSYAKAFIAQATCQLAYSETMINEIQALPRNSYVKIDLSQRSRCMAEVCLIDRQEEYIPLNTSKAIELLDVWHDKWNRIINAIMRSGLPFSCDISGGKDTRAANCTLLQPRLDLKTVRFNSSTDGIFTHADDYKIAQEIASIYDFELNKGPVAKRYKIDPVDNVMYSLFAKCGFHKELLFTGAFSEDVEFRMMGEGSGSLRDLMNMPVDDYIAHEVQNNVFNSIDCNSDLERLLYASKAQIEETLSKVAERSNRVYQFITPEYYQQVKIRNHVGKALVELFLANRIVVAPLMDPILHAFNQDIGRDNDRDLTFAVIYERYAPELNNVPFDSKRIIIPETLAVAREINQQFPFAPSRQTADNTSHSISIINNRRIRPKKSASDQEAKQILKMYFESDDLRGCISETFGSEIYNKTLSYFNHVKYHPTIPVAALVEIFVIMRAAQQSRSVENLALVNTPTIFEPKPFSHSCYHNNGFMKEMLYLLSSSRIDIRCRGDKDAQLLIDCDDSNLFIEKPDWANDSTGRVYVCQSGSGRFSLRLKCVGNSELTFIIRGPFMKDADDATLPIKVDFNYVKIVDYETKKTVLQHNKQFTVSHDRYKSDSIMVADGQSLELSAEWLPFIYEEDELTDLLHHLYDKKLKAFTFWRNPS